MRTVGLALALVPVVLMAGAAAAPVPPRKDFTPEATNRRLCEVRHTGRVVFHGACRETFGKDGKGADVTLYVAGGKTYRITDDTSPPDQKWFVFNANRFEPDLSVMINGQKAVEGDIDGSHEVYIVPDLTLTLEVAAAEDAFGPDRPGRRVVSTITHKREKVGQCFETRVSDVGHRLEGDAAHPQGEPGSGSALSFADGHYVVLYEEVPAMNQSRVGDRVRLCVHDLPRNCWPGDTRGIGYTGLNKRTGAKWEAGDSEHSCGGA